MVYNPHRHISDPHRDNQLCSVQRRLSTNRPWSLVNAYPMAAAISNQWHGDDHDGDQTLLNSFR